MVVTVYVLWWKYHDGSGVKIEQVYSCKEVADKLCAMLNGEGAKEWSVAEKEVLDWK